MTSVLIGLAQLLDFVKNVETLPAILFVVGLLLLASETLTAGFGVAGGLGLLILIAGILLTAETLWQAFVMFAILLILVALVIWVLLRSAKKGRLAKKLILWTATRKEDGFSASAETTDWVGREGTAVTPLRPSGIGEFDGNRMDVVTEGAFIAAGTPIRVARTEGRRVVVRPIE